MEWVDWLYLLDNWHYAESVRMYLSVLSPNAGKYGPEKLRMRKLLTQCEV